MNIKEFLNLVCNEIKYKTIKSDIYEEIKVHIEEIKQEYIDKGLDENKAEYKAVEQMGNATEIGRKLNKIHKPKLDWKLLIIMTIVIGFGALITVTKFNSYVLVDNEVQPTVNKYIIFVLIGIVGSIIVYFFDYRKMLKYSKILYIFATISIIWAFLFGIQVNGIPYIRIGVYFISASAIAMPAYIIAFVGFLQNVNKETNIKIKFLEKKNININITKIIVFSAISLVLFTLIPSFTSAIIVGISYLVIATVKMIQDKNNSLKNIMLLWGIPLILTLSIIILYTGGVGEIVDRATISYNPEIDPNGKGWLGMNRNLIINSAQLFGTADNMSNALNIFDEGTNFAFISLLAHYGWIVSIGLIVAIILMNIKLIINAIQVKDIYGKNLIIGIASMFISQSVFNILMNLNLGVEANFNMPFVSYGGIELIMNMICLALLLSIYRRKDIILNKSVEVI